VRGVPAEALDAAVTANFGRLFAPSHA